jgi:hypothetical protein
MHYGLICLFDLLDKNCGIKFPARGIASVPQELSCQRNLFDEAGAVPGEIKGSQPSPPISVRDIAVITGLYSSGGPDLAALPETARRLFELSVNGFDAFVHAWMSGFPIEAEIVRFGRGILAAARQRGGPGTERPAADKAASDRGDPDTRTVLEAAYKVRHEIERLRGFLRFNPDEYGVYIARCSPDHFALPALCEHFTRRFGDTSWEIIDERRRLCLHRLRGEEPELLELADLPRFPAGPQAAPAEWEKLWRHYHKTINNESRNNPGLQRKFIPKRYWKYLPEL